MPPSTRTEAPRIQQRMRRIPMAIVMAMGLLTAMLTTTATAAAQSDGRIGAYLQGGDSIGSGRDAKTLFLGLTVFSETR